MNRLLNFIFMPVKSAVVKRLRPNRVVAETSVVTVATSKPRRARLHRRLSRSPVVAWLEARRAVNAGISRTELLTHRLRAYLTKRPQVAYPLPDIRIGADDHVDVTWPPDPRHPNVRALDEGTPIEEIDALADGARRDLQAAECEQTKVNAQRALLESEIAEVDRETVEAGTTSDPADTRHRHERMPSLTLVVFLRMFQMLLIGAESFLTFVALANQGGVDVSNLSGEFRTNPWGVAGYGLAATGCAALLFILTDRIYSAIQRLVEQTEYDARRGVKILGIVLATALVLGVSIAVTDMRQSLSAAAAAYAGTELTARHTAPWFGFLLLVLLPLAGGTCVEEVVKRLVRRREEMLSARAVPTKDELAALRRRELLQKLHADLEEVRRRGAQLSASITLSLAQIRAAEAARRDAARDEERIVRCFVDDVLACTSQDRKQFTMIATSRKRTDLLGRTPAPAPAASEATVVQIAKGRGRSRHAATAGAMVLVAIGLLRCAAPEAHDAATTAVVLRDRSVTAQDTREAAIALDAWLRSAGHADTFGIWVPSATPHRAASIFRATVPERWSNGNALGMKAAFGRDTRAGLLQALRGTTAAVDDDTAPDTSAMSIRVLPSTDSRGRPWNLTPAAAPVHDLVICDASSSGLGHTCTAPAVRAAYDRWLGEGATRQGSTFTVLVTGTSLSATRTLFTIETPDAPLLTRVAALLSGSSDVEQATAHIGSSGSAIAEAMFAAVTLLRERTARGGRGHLLVLSDLREVSDGGAMNLEAAIPSAEDFTRWMRTQGLIAPADGIEITICGVHYEVASGAASLTAAEVTALRAAWTAGLSTWKPAALRICTDCTGELDRAREPVAVHTHTAA